jgi:hypothetical protein
MSRTSKGDSKQVDNGRQKINKCLVPLFLDLSECHVTSWTREMQYKYSKNAPYSPQGGNTAKMWIIEIDKVLSEWKRILKQPTLLMSFRSLKLFRHYVSLSKFWKPVQILGSLKTPSQVFNQQLRFSLTLLSKTQNQSKQNFFEVPSSVSNIVLTSNSKKFSTFFILSFFLSFLFFFFLGHFVFSLGIVGKQTDSRHTNMCAYEHNLRNNLNIRNSI